jgi:hypothetical protein
MPTTGMFAARIRLKMDLNEVRDSERSSPLLLARLVTNDPATDKPHKLHCSPLAHRFARAMRTAGTACPSVRTKKGSDQWKNISPQRPPTELD